MKNKRIPHQETHPKEMLKEVLQMCVHAQLFLTLCDSIDCSLQGPLSMGFPRQEYWSGLPFPPLGDLPHPETEPMSPVSLASAGGLFTFVTPGKPKFFRRKKEKSKEQRTREQANLGKYKNYFPFLL